MTWLMVFLGGGLGSLCRFGIAAALPTVDLSKGQFPWATLLANLFACLTLGALIALVSKQTLSREQSLFLVTGFCGGFSTFSTFSAELLGLYEAGYYTTAAIYALVSLTAGVLAVLLTLSLLR